MHSPIHCLNLGARYIVLVGGTTYLSDLECLDNWISHQSICLSTMQRRGIVGGGNVEDACGNEWGNAKVSITAEWEVEEWKRWPKFGKKTISLAWGKMTHDPWKTFWIFDIVYCDYFIKQSLERFQVRKFQFLPIHIWNLNFLSKRKILSPDLKSQNWRG